MTERPCIRVRNWEKYQHYTDRNPPWIKFHTCLLDDYDLASLPDSAKAHLFGIWLLASKLGNEIPDDPEFIATRINAQERVDLNLLVARGFLVRAQNASKTLATCKQSASPETETETETEKNLRTCGAQPLALVGRDEQPDLFEEFWSAYPKKKDKARARKVWARLKLNRGQHEQIMAALDEQKRSDQWRDAQFIPYPTTWLNGERWEDETPTDADRHVWMAKFTEEPT